MPNEITEIIYIALLDEGVDVWRPVDAIPIGKGTYKIKSENSNPDDEQWQFVTGDTVYCEEKRFQNGKKGLVAVKKV